LLALLNQKHLLLVLDNCEHLLAATPLVVEILRSCHHVKVLATSRAPVRVSGEQVFPVSPLPVPDLGHLPPLGTMSDYAAIALFVERAARVRPDFALTLDNAPAITSICARLDGLPLAIELAAVRVRSLPPRTLLEQLVVAADTPSLRLLADGPRDAPERHQTLRSTIAWSHDLLTPAEQRLFGRLAVFASGWTLEAAEGVVATPSLLDGLLSLVDKSLVMQEEVVHGALRFRMLETIRAFAWERLAASGEEDALRRRHADYLLATVEATGALLFAKEGTRSRLAAEQGNIQAALHWLVQNG
jgi:non-specific serine/threonine protein kinase